MPSVAFGNKAGLGLSFSAHGGAGRPGSDYLSFGLAGVALGCC